MIGLEAPVLQEAHLAGFFLEIGWRLAAELLLPDFAGQRVPVGTGFGDGELYVAGPNAALREILAYTDRPLTLFTRD